MMRNGAVMLPGGLPLLKIQGEVTGELRVSGDAFENPEIERLMSDTQIAEEVA